MKIEINTADILGDEATIRDEVIEQIADALKTEMRRNAETIIRDTLEKSLKETVHDQVHKLVTMHLDTEFTEKNTYGRVGETTTVRNKIADILKAQCVFKKTNYSSDRNAFSSAIMDAVSDEVKKFRKEFNSLVNKQTIQTCLDDATEKLKKAVGIK